jgi:arsenite methyltransferase
MTPEMLERARSNAETGGYANVEFRLGEIEALPVADGSVDVIISNCVLNLSADKPKVLSEAFRVLKSGGRIVVSDMVSDVEVPDVMEKRLDSVAACLPTFRDVYIQQFRDAGFEEVRISDERPYPAAFILEDPGVRAYVTRHPEQQAEMARFADSIYGAHFEASKP